MIRTKSGFTLIEVLIVVVIIGVLASLIIPRFLPQTERAHVAEAVNMLGAIRQGEKGYHLETGNYLAPADDDDWGRLGIDNPNSAKWTYAADAGTGAATATRDAGAGSYAGTTVILNIDGTWDAGSTHPYTPSN